MAARSHPGKLRRQIRLAGVVQGVGFRPFVYSLAARTGVRGFVLNSSSGVTIEAEGAAPAVENFLDLLQRDPPPLARIENVSTAELEPLGDSGFEIRESVLEPGAFALISPDMAACAECLREIADPRDRRFAYPFTNCTNCGPRYSIVRDVPYDRPATTMAPFQMCPQCAAEYSDYSNRRFHAQPNACPQCGPSVSLFQSGSPVPVQFRAAGSGRTPAAMSAFALGEVRRLLREGAIVAIKGLGGFQLACDAENDAAVRQLRLRKHRGGKPFALMVRDLASAEELGLLSPADRELLLSRQRPIVLLCRRPGTKLSPAIAPGAARIGVMLAYTPLHFLLFGEQPAAPPEFPALVMTSGNISDEPIVISLEEAQSRFGGVADAFLSHDRGIYMRVDDSVACSFEGRPRLLRRSRGYVPEPIDLGSPVSEVLACGAELKNTFCLTKGRYAILSQHIGDLQNYETLAFFRETLENLKNLFRVKPRAAAHDLHPLYLSTRLAAGLGLPMIGIQHHHAHIASCMAENGLGGQVIGVAFDGTGYGTDGQVWGGEFLLAGLGGFERRAHFRYIPLPGGDAAVRQTWRPALSWLREAFGAEFLQDCAGDLALFREVPERDIALVSRMLERGVNTVLTSSCGRLFDAVASLIGLRQQATFEGQAAIELEAICQPEADGAYAFEVTPQEPAQIDLRPAIREIVRDLRKSAAAPLIAGRFHNTIAAVIAEVCGRIRERDGLNRVCLSGGTFQNHYLLERAVGLLLRLGFEVFLHSRVPPNDGGISLGQAVIANAVLSAEA